jgi:hypothetical protein
MRREAGAPGNPTGYHKQLEENLGRMGGGRTFPPINLSKNWSQVGASSMTSVPFTLCANSE